MQRSLSGWPKLLASLEVGCGFGDWCPPTWPTIDPFLGPSGTIVFESDDGGETWLSHAPLQPPVSP